MISLFEGIRKYGKFDNATKRYVYTFSSPVSLEMDGLSYKALGLTLNTYASVHKDTAIRVTLESDGSFTNDRLSEMEFGTMMKILNQFSSEIRNHTDTFKDRILKNGVHLDSLKATVVTIYPCWCNHNMRDNEGFEICTLLINDNEPDSIVVQLSRGGIGNLEVVEKKLSEIPMEHIAKLSEYLKEYV